MFYFQPPVLTLLRNSGQSGSNLNKSGLNSSLDSKFINSDKWKMEYP